MPAHQIGWRKDHARAAIEWARSPNPNPSYLIQRYIGRRQSLFHRFPHTRDHEFGDGVLAGQ